jgi:hypothetical protein
VADHRTALKAFIRRWQAERPSSPSPKQVEAGDFLARFGREEHARLREAQFSQLPVPGSTFTAISAGATG